MLLPKTDYDTSAPLIQTLKNGFARKGSITLNNDFQVLDRIFWAETGDLESRHIKINLFTYVKVENIIKQCNLTTVLPENARLRWQEMTGVTIKSLSEVKYYHIKERDPKSTTVGSRLKFLSTKDEWSVVRS